MEKPNFEQSNEPAPLSLENLLEGSLEYQMVERLNATSGNAETMAREYVIYSDLCKQADGMIEFCDQEGLGWLRGAYYVPIKNFYHLMREHYAQLCCLRLTSKTEGGDSHPNRDFMQDFEDLTSKVAGEITEKGTPEPEFILDFERVKKLLSGEEREGAIGKYQQCLENVEFLRAHELKPSMLAMTFSYYDIPLRELETVCRDVVFCAKMAKLRLQSGDLAL